MYLKVKFNVCTSTIQLSNVDSAMSVIKGLLWRYFKTNYGWGGVTPCRTLRKIFDSNL